MIYTLFALMASTLVLLFYFDAETLLLFSFFFLAFLLAFFFHYKKFLFYKKENNHLKKTLKTLGNIFDIAVFNEKGDACYTETESQAPQTLSQFLSLLTRHFSTNAHLLNFQHWLQEHHRGETVLYEGQKGVTEKEKWKVGYTLPFSFQKENYIIAVLADISTYFRHYNMLSSQKSKLESLIDDAPFALFYVSQKNVITAANKRFSQWFGVEKEKIMDLKTKDIFSKYTDEPSFVTVKPPKKKSFQGLLFPAKDVRTPFLLCRVPRMYESDLMKDSAFIYAPIPAVMITEEGKICAFNPSFSLTMSDIAQVNKHEISLGASFFALVNSFAKQSFEKALAKETGGRLPPFEVVFNNSQKFSTVYASIIEGQQRIILMYFIDISEQKRLEFQFTQSQKMQAVGQLAGGIAHDFNNLLTAMIGFCDLLLERYIPSDPSYNDVIQIKQNANRAANLVRQLLAFSRQQTLQPKFIHITDILSELHVLLSRLIGANIELKVLYGDNLWSLKVDPNQLEQVIINLVVNARDAMSRRGTLTIKAKNYSCTKERNLGHDILLPGDYVVLEFKDTGHGIKKEHIAHIFEPFFSTKEVGAGTGLGLSTVYGIIKQTDGYITVSSEEGVGTTFTVYLPRYEETEEDQQEIIETTASDLTGKETILLVEDEEPVRLFSARALREKGYHVLEAESGEAALHVIKKHKHIDLLVTDVVMPKMDGPTLNKEIKTFFPQIKTIFISGYTEDTFRKNLADEKIYFLSKPFTLKQLASIVKSVLS